MVAGLELSPQQVVIRKTKCVAKSWIQISKHKDKLEVTQIDNYRYKENEQ